MGTNEPPSLTDDGPELVFVRTVSERRIECLATGDAVVVFIAATGRGGDQVFHAGLPVGNRLFAEEATVALEEEETIKLLQV